MERDDVMFKATAMIHSLKDTAEVSILHENGCNDVIADYNGQRCTAIFNGFVCLYYVDDIYGKLTDPHQCPRCHAHIA
jgi:hypothetical protein